MNFEYISVSTFLFLAVGDDISSDESEESIYEDVFNVDGEFLMHKIPLLLTPYISVTS